MAPNGLNQSSILSSTAKSRKISNYDGQTLYQFQQQHLLQQQTNLLEQVIKSQNLKKDYETETPGTLEFRTLTSFSQAPRYRKSFDSKIIQIIRYLTSPEKKSNEFMQF